MHIQVISGLGPGVYFLCVFFQGKGVFPGSQSQVETRGTIVDIIPPSCSSAIVANSRPANLRQNILEIFFRQLE